MRPWVFWAKIALWLLATVLFTVVLWYGGPLIQIGDDRPLEGFWTLFTISGVVWLIVLAIIGWRVWKRIRTERAIRKAMTQAVVDDSDAPALKAKMDTALATLGKSDRFWRNPLYELPWYLIIGPPGAGKTTALVNSGLRFPLAGDKPAEAIEGVGGTRYCDWWFTDDAVLIDTAGRYTTQDSDASNDSKSWRSFLEMLRLQRPLQPINGVIVAISIADVLGLAPSEINKHADAIRKRLDELHEELKVAFPVYAVFTKMDLVAGFSPYFADLDELKRNEVWGATFPGENRKANQVGLAGGEIDLLTERLSERMADRLQYEPDLRSRTLLFGLPAQMTAIRKPVTDFLNRVFESSRFQSQTMLRGFYFTSATQEGTPIDAVIGALRKSFGVDNVGAAAVATFTGPGKSYFLHDLLKKVVFAEAGWVSTNFAALRRRYAVRIAAFALIALATLGLCGLWWMSYQRNEDLLARTDKGFETFGSLSTPIYKDNPIHNFDLRPLYEVIGVLPELPAGYAPKEPWPWTATFGLSQRSRAEVVSVDTYRRALETMLRPRLLMSLEKQIGDNIADPMYVYEALKIYLMVGGQAPKIERREIVDWFVSDWARGAYRGAPSQDLREKLRQHLEAMIDLNTDGKTDIALDGDLVKRARGAIANMRVADRAYAILEQKSHNLQLEDWIAGQRGGLNVEQVFEGKNHEDLNTIRVPGFFTYEGFYIALLDPIKSVATELQDDKWLLGDFGEQKAISNQYSNLYPDILEIYRQHFVGAWLDALGRLQLKSLLADKPHYTGLAYASGPTSPIMLLLESVRDETAVTRERTKPQHGPDNSSAIGKRAAQMAKNHMNSNGQFAVDLAMKNQNKPSDFNAEIPEKRIEAPFKDIYALVDGDPPARPVDNLLANLDQLLKSLQAATDNPALAKQAGVQALQLAQFLHASVSKLPPPANGWVESIANAARGDASAISLAQLNDDLSQNVTGECQRIVTGHYPFVGKGPDVALGDFGRLFAPNGIIDRFFVANVAPLVNMSGGVWRWKPNAAADRKLSEASLRSFQQAAEIRDALFANGGGQPSVNFQARMLSLDPASTSVTLALNGAAPFVYQSASAMAALASPAPTPTPTPTTPSLFGAATPTPTPSSPPTPAPTATATATTSQVAWPGAGDVKVAFQPESSDTKSSIERRGPWALFHLVDAYSPSQAGGAVKVSFAVGAHYVEYQFTASTSANPLTLPALRQFTCPAGL